ncbi:MAG: gliding motility-associated C-terminal domain-containing protein [Chitinophagaceae bacterium]|nr:gliding motility-associated C-terminal domain-containing protein [Chitinophagaceae bacterium]
MFNDHTTGCSANDSVNIFVENANISSLVIYNMVTPNGDNRNDTWIINGIEEYPNNHVSIFNQWGDKIREFTSYNNSINVWKGTNSKDEPIPDGTYFYILKINNIGSR